jgi:sugar phosphate isomerase/epimerase
MKLSASTWIFGDEPLARSLDRLRRFGCDGVEVLGEADAYDPADIDRLCRERELKVFSVLNMATGSRDLAHPDAGVREGAIAHVRSCLEFAHALGAESVSTILTSVFRTAPVEAGPGEEEWQRARDREWEHAVKAVRTLAGRAAELGLMLAIEPVNRYETYLLRTAEQAREFVAEVGSRVVRVQLDTFHMSIEEADPARAIRETGSLLCNLHLADSNRRAVGDGKLDWPAILAALRDTGYDGPLTLEPAPPESDLFLAVRMKRHAALRDRDIESSVAHLRKSLAGLSSGGTA